MKRYPIKRRRFAAVTAFFRRNGVYAAAAACLAVFGLAAAGLWAGSGQEKPARSSGDETLEEVSSSTQAPVESAVLITPAAASPTAYSTPAPQTPTPTLMPDITPAPSYSPAPQGKKLGASPVDGTLLRPYSMDALIWSGTLRQWMTHSGVDIRAPKGEKVYAAAAGTVTRVYEDDLMGVTVQIDHGEGLATLYCGLKKDVAVKEGDAVKERAEIGEVGSTAISECAEESHLHFEVRVDGRPADPEAFVLIKKLEKSGG